MDCELCGRHAELVKAEVEGITLSVCNNCAQFGRRLEVTAEIKEKRPLTIDVSSINPNFAKIIRNARTAQKLTLENLATKINEKSSVLDRVEKGMRPTDSLARKLEKTLKIKLLGFEE